ncbi:MAG: hypothetical protein AAF515_21380 [Pseudomonadota bacterium]
MREVSPSSRDSSSPDVDATELWRPSAIVAVTLVVVAALWLAFVWQQVNTLNARSELLSDNIAVKEKLLAHHSASLASIGHFDHKHESQGLALHTRVVGPSVVNVEVFSRPVDQEAVVSALGSLDFDTDVTVRPPNPTIPAETRTNAIWYGAEVGSEQVRRVALALMQADVDIFVIEPLPESEGSPETIQVGSRLSGLPQSPYTPASLSLGPSEGLRKVYDRRRHRNGHK